MSCYTMDTHFLHVAIEGEERIIAISAVDVRATEAANRARGAGSQAVRANGIPRPRHGT